MLNDILSLSEWDRWLERYELALFNERRRKAKVEIMKPILLSTDKFQAIHVWNERRAAAERAAGSVYDRVTKSAGSIAKTKKNEKDGAEMRKLAAKCAAGGIAKRRARKRAGVGGKRGAGKCGCERGEEEKGTAESAGECGAVEGEGDDDFE